MMNLLLLYTLRSSGAQELPLSPLYRHIAPLEQIYLLPSEALGDGLGSSTYGLRKLELRWRLSGKLGL